MTRGQPTRELMDARGFVELFTEGWSSPGGIEGFLTHFLPLMAPDVRLLQSIGPPIVGHAGVRRQFTALFDLLDDVRGEVTSWSVEGEVAHVELTIHGRLGARTVALETCDRLVVRDGKLVERRAYLEPLPLLRAIAVTPRSWPKAARLLTSR